MNQAAIDRRLIKDAAERYASLPFGERGAFVAEKAEQWEVSECTVKRWFSKQGVTQKRKKRSDRGATRIKREHLEAVLSLLVSARRKNGQWSMPVDIAVNIAEQNGLVPTGYHPSTWRSQLRRAQMDTKTMSQMTPGQKVPSRATGYRTEYPLQVVEVDASVCLQWKTTKNGKLAFESTTKFYPTDIKSYKDKRNYILRLIAIDKHTGMFHVRYYNAPGESAAVWIDFLLTLFYPKGPTWDFPFYGVPDNIYTDRGSGLMARETQNLLKYLDINCLTHIPGNPRAKGSVERMHGYWQSSFESRLAIKRAESVEALNEWALDAAKELNQKPDFRKTGKSREQLWLEEFSKNEEPRELPAGNIEEVVKLAHKEPVTRDVQPDGRIEYFSRRYIAPDSIPIGVKVPVWPCPYYKDTLNLKWNDTVYRAPEDQISSTGQSRELPVFGEYKRAADSTLDKNLKTAQAVDISNVNPFIGMTSQESIASIVNTDRKIIDITNEETIMSRADAQRAILNSLGSQRLYNEYFQLISGHLKVLESEHGGVPWSKADLLVSQIQKEEREKALTANQ